MIRDYRADKLTQDYICAITDYTFLMHHSDFCISGAGIIGLSLALELNRRGATVTVLDQGDPLAEASTAAAGMLAANDPENPSQLHALSNLSNSLYPSYLSYLEALSGIPVPFQTSLTLQALSPAHSSTDHVLSSAEVKSLLPPLNPRDRTFICLEEHSVDPGQLAPSLLGAVRAARIDLRLHTPVSSISSQPHFAEIHTSAGTLTANRYIDCTGAWAVSLSHRSQKVVTPKKGQVLYIEVPTSLNLQIVVRSPEVYIAPRTTGPHAGQAIIGATVEDQGFDTTVNPADIARLHAAASRFLPALESATILESWAGLRPGTPDSLPLLGEIPGSPHAYLATGHYRNGILLAPATAHVMGQLLCNERVSIDLTPFAPSRCLAA